MENYVVTISRQFASFGRSIAQKMSEELQIEFYDRDIVEATAKRMGQPIPVISNEEENSNSIFFRRKYPLGMGVANIQDEIFNVQTNIIRDIAKRESCIIVGRCAGSVLKDYAKCLNIYIYAPYECRLKNCTESLQMDPKVTKKMIKEIDKARENYRYRYCPEVANVYDGYDVMIDSSRFGVDKTAKILVDIVKSTLLT
ncbi:cytidylate kinase-like family protein [Anaerocolumna sp. MB42-C2]|uniref:cytidylate kinase-like family protein n=1 Tax=Anaerocolumna sp. MB42-C2 TaxID=3070997 RepID=UPI0027E18BC6|nr:cytidylate kinase-like family protein [Anaerocolumna sp. MB42-C2]WMJ86992.1 cytidylate kinase-like family protein [Anaerocolumna sp. MB42-C2]